MPAPARNYLSREALWALLLTFAIFAASSRPRLAAPDLDFNLAVTPDKIAHFLVFGLLATSIARIPRLARAGFLGALLAAALTSSYGVLDELHQSTTPGRSVETADALADATGAFLAAFLYAGWPRYRRFLEFPLRRSRICKTL
ncbi:MAG: VanZ family protein [Opitutales bacterium]